MSTTHPLLKSLFDLDPAKVSEVRGLMLGPLQTVQAVFTCKGPSRPAYGQSQRFTVMQRQDGEIVGGSTFELRLRRARGLHPVSHVRVILEKVRITDDHDPWFKGRGEFSFAASVGFNDVPDRRHTVRLPPRGTIKIGDRPGANEHRLDVCVFDGFVAEADRMTIEIAPTEHDWLTRDDRLCRYRRRFDGPPETWVGRHGPDDEGPADPERLSDWMLWYRVESLPLG